MCRRARVRGGHEQRLLHDDLAVPASEQPDLDAGRDADRVLRHALAPAGEGPSQPERHPASALHRKRRRDERATSPLHGLQREVLRSPYQIDWVRSGKLVYLVDGDFYGIAPGQKPKRFATVNTSSFATDPAGDRLAGGFGFPSCLTCGGPVTVLDVPSGHVVGR